LKKEETKEKKSYKNVTNVGEISFKEVLEMIEKEDNIKNSL